MKITRLMAALGVAVVAVAFGLAGHAIAQTTGSPFPTTWNLAPLWTDVAVPMLTALIPVAGAYVSLRIGQYLHIQNTDTMRGALETAMNMGLQAAQAKLPPGTPITIDVRNALTAQALNYATSHAKTEIDKLGYSPDRVAESIRARASALMPHVVSPVAAGTMQAPATS